MSVNSKMRAIADAIRSRSGETGMLSLDDMAVSIQGLGRSQIIVTAPTGSTVTASVGGLTKTAVEKDGTWTFRNCDLGTWTVTASLGEKVRTQEVVLARLEIVYLEIKYGTYLFDRGEQFEDITGGWILKSVEGDGGTGKPAFTVGETIVVDASQGSANYVYWGALPTNMIDLTDVNTVKFNILSVTGTSDVTIAVGTNIGTLNKNPAANVKIKTGTVGTVALDVSSLSGSHYVCIYPWRYGAGTGSAVEFDSVWLE